MEEYAVYTVEDGCGHPLLSSCEALLELEDTLSEVLTLLVCGAWTCRGSGPGYFHNAPLSSRQPHIPRQRGQRFPTAILPFLDSVKMSNHLQMQAQARINKLTFLLDKSTIYAKIIGDRMARQQIEKRKAEKRAETIKANKEKKGDAVTVRESTRDKKPKVKEEEVEESGKRKRRGDANGSSKKVKVEDEVSSQVKAKKDKS